VIKPKAVKKGATIGIVAPSGPEDRDKINKGIKVLENMGFKVKLSENAFCKYGYLAGEDDFRAEEINRMFLDDSIDAIIALRGGYGAPRILDKINYEIIKENPKVFIGYSDITALHISINQLCGLITFHGPMVTSDMAEDFHDFSKESLLRAISNTSSLGKITNPGGEKILSLSGGRAEGILTGGNLSLICSTLGTSYEIDTEGKILFIEDIDEEPYSVDRMLTQLKLSGKLEKARGIIIGDWNNCVPEDPEKSLTLMEIFEDILLPLKKPIIYNVKAGHCNPMITLPLGAKISIDGDKGEIYIEESAVI